MKKIRLTAIEDDFNDYEDMGVQEGDFVVIGDLEFEYVH